MALPQQLKAARMTDETLASTIDNEVGNLEKALCDIFGFTIDTDITESPLSCDNSGRITKALLRLVAAAVVGVRFRDSTNSKEFRLGLNNTNILIDENTGTEGSPSWTNRVTINLSTGLITLGTAADPSADNDLIRKAWAVAQFVLLTGEQTITGNLTISKAGGATILSLLAASGQVPTVYLKETGKSVYWQIAKSLTDDFIIQIWDGDSWENAITIYDSSRVVEFAQIPQGPTSDPTTDNQLARKAYVDGKKKKIVIPHTWTIPGDIEVGELLHMYVTAPAGQTVKLIKAKHMIKSGTSATVKLNSETLGDITGWTGINVTTTGTVTDGPDTALTDGDYFRPIVTAISGTPQNMTFTVWLEYEV